MDTGQTPEPGELIIYTATDGTAHTEVRLQNDTLWLSEKQIAGLFGRDRTVVGRHIRSIFQTGELDEESNVQKMHIALSDKPVVFFSLDVVISVGYRVSSQKGTQFRIWANRVLKEHLVRGYTLNEARLREQENQLKQLKETIVLVERSLNNQVEDLGQARTIVTTLAQFANGLGILDDYDHERLENKGRSSQTSVVISESEFLGVIKSMRGQFDSDVFGLPKDDSFHSSAGQIYQSFGGLELYPSVEHKAAMLLYLVVKNHSFVDGNKRIAAALFLYFLEHNGLLYRPDGQTILGNDGLAALTLLIAESKTAEMETLVKLVMTILNRGQS